MKTRKILVFVSVLINFMALSMGTIYGLRRTIFSPKTKPQIAYDSCQVTQNTYYQGKEAAFIQPQSKTVVFLGDSLTDFGNWPENLNQENIVNRGIPEDTTCGLLTRLAPILQSHPKQVFLLIGINDMIRGTPTQDIQRNYRQILTLIREKSPRTKVFVKSVLPISESSFYAAKVKNEDILQFNRYLQRLSQEFDYQYIDLYPLFLKDENLNPAFQFDGLHLNRQGYAVWRREVKKYIDRSR
jgi:lysophospholipase L1-like esterase